MNYIHETAVMYIFLSFLSMTLLFLGGTYLRLGRLTVEPSAYALERIVGVEPNSTQLGRLVSHLGLTRNLVAGRGNAPRSVRLMRPSGST